jgi:uncharacterized protein (DUF697 family)
MSSETEKIRREQAKKIIRNAAIASSTAAAAVAQIAAFGVDLALSTPIVVNMIVELGELFEQPVDKVVAVSFASYLVGVASGAYVAKSIVGFIPILGNFANAAITYPLIELIGWTAYEIFENDVDLSNMNKKEIQAYMRRVERKRNQ